MDRKLANRLSATFEERFGTIPLLIWSPGRINIIGEHTDYNQGFVLPAAIDKGILLALQKSERSVSTWVAKDIREECQTDLSKGVPDHTAGWKGYFYGILAELKKRGIHPEPFNLMFRGNIPQGAGLSSSAALSNAFIFGLNEVFNLGLSRMEMALISNAAELDYVGVQCGIMDQYTGMFGRTGKAIFLDCRSLESELIPLQMEGYQWLLLDTGVKHKLSETAYNERRDTCEAVASKFGVTSLRDLSLHHLESEREELPEDDYSKARFVLEENARVIKSVEAMKKKDFVELGRLMYESHDGLQKQYLVSCKELDFLVELARESDGILGARMMGGGFGGCTLNLVREDACQSITECFKQAYRKHFGRTLTHFTVNFSGGCDRLHY